MTGIVHDLSYAARTLLRNQGFTIVVVLTLALGIGANSAVFTIVNAVLLRPLPFPQADRLALISVIERDTPFAVGSYPDFDDARALSASFAGMAAFTSRGVTLRGGEQAESVPGLQVTPGFFEVLGVAPALGRTFRPYDQVAGSQVALLSHEAWKRHFAGRTDAVGQTVRLETWPSNEQSYTVGRHGGANDDRARDAGRSRKESYARGRSRRTHL